MESLLGSIKDPLQVHGHEFKVRPHCTAVCFSPVYSAVWMEKEESWILKDCSFTK